MATASQEAGGGFVAGIRPYLEPAPLTALFLGISSGFPFTLLAATLTQRLSEAGIEKKSISAFACCRRSVPKLPAASAVFN